MKLSYENEAVKKALLIRRVLATHRRSLKSCIKLGLRGKNVRLKNY